LLSFSVTGTGGVVAASSLSHPGIVFTVSASGGPVLGETVAQPKLGFTITASGGPVLSELVSAASTTTVTGSGGPVLGETIAQPSAGFTATAHGGPVLSELVSAPLTVTVTAHGGPVLSGLSQAHGRFYQQTWIGGVSYGGSAENDANLVLHGFTTWVILDLTVRRVGDEILLQWESSLPKGYWYQVYINNVLTKWTQETKVVITYPVGNVQYKVGAVPTGQQSFDFSSTFPVTPKREITLNWTGGRYLGDDIAGFHVYMSDGPNVASIDYNSIVATVPAFDGNNITDGFGLGGFGDGGFGRASNQYTWTSDHLARGLWRVGVKSFDMLGNEGSPDEGSIQVDGPPDPPARDTRGNRVEYTYNQPTHTATVTWLPSPG
jgi:hypothetical protein